MSSLAVITFIHSTVYLRASTPRIAPTAAELANAMVRLDIVSDLDEASSLPEKSKEV